MSLAEYLRSLEDRKRQAGIHDCVTLCADWAVSCGRADPMEPWRGAYFSEVEAEELIADAGGLRALFATGMEAAGIPSADGPQSGDIGVVSLMGEEAGAIFTGKRWVFVPERGLGFVSLDAECIVGLWRP
jgi:hypothetical protein